MSIISKLREKTRSWISSNQDAAERYRAERKILEAARQEAKKNEMAIAKADQILLRDRLAKLDEKLDKAEK